MTTITTIIIANLVLFIFLYKCIAIHNKRKTENYIIQELKVMYNNEVISNGNASKLAKSLHKIIEDKLNKLTK